LASYFFACSSGTGTVIGRTSEAANDTPAGRQRWKTIV
jgi:hypothetical protein